MKSGRYRVIESARTYHYPGMTVRIEGAEYVDRYVQESDGVTLVKDIVESANGDQVSLRYGFTGVVQEGDEAPPSQVEVTNGRLYENSAKLV